MAIDITKIIVKHTTGRPAETIPMCVGWLYDTNAGKRKPEAPQEGRWCGRGWVVWERNERYILECKDPQVEQRFSLIWL